MRLIKMIVVEQSKLLKFKNIDLIKTRNLAKFKNIKNSSKYKNSNSILIKFKNYERSSILNFAARLAYTRLRYIY